MSVEKLEFVTIEEVGRIATVRFDRGFKANALSLALLGELTEVARPFADRPDISAVILTGRSDCFSMGMDLKDEASMAARRAGLSQRRISLRAGPRMCQAWEEVDAITIAAIEGWCVGGGAALAVSCDLRVMGASARLYVPEVERGFNMSWGSVPRITALVGPAKSKRVVTLCEKLDAATAERWGLADEVVADGEAVSRARAFASRAAELPPSAMKMTKHDVNVAAHALARATAHRDLDAFALTERSEDFKEGVSAFLEKRPATFTGA